MADTADALRAERQRVLDVIAQGGARAKAEYDAQKAVADQQNQALVGQALNSQYKSEPLQTQNANVLNQVVNERDALNQRRLAVTQKYLNDLQASQVGWSDFNLGRLPQIEAEQAFKDAASGGGSGGRRRGGGGGGGRRGGGGGGGGGSGHSGSSGSHWKDNWFYTNELDIPFGSVSHGGMSAYKQTLRDDAAQGVVGPKGRVYTRQNSPGFIRRQVASADWAPGSELWASGTFSAPKQFRYVANEAQKIKSPDKAAAYVRATVKRGQITQASGNYLVEQIRRAARSNKPQAMTRAPTGFRAGF